MTLSFYFWHRSFFSGVESPHCNVRKKIITFYYSITTPKTPINCKINFLGTRVSSLDKKVFIDKEYKGRLQESHVLESHMTLLFENDPPVKNRKYPFVNLFSMKNITLHCRYLFSRNLCLNLKLLINISLYTLVVDYFFLSWWSLHVQYSKVSLLTEGEGFSLVIRL